MHKKVTKKDTFHVSPDDALEGAFVNAIEQSAEDSSESTAKGLLQDLYKDAQEGAFQVKIKGVLEVTAELHLKMLMVVHLLMHKIAQNDSIKT